MISSGLEYVSIQAIAPKAESSSELKKIFSAAELDYCFRHRPHLPRLAGTYAAKKAAFTALRRAGKRVRLRDIDVTHGPSGRPGLFLRNRLEPGAAVSVSISHTDTVAIAVCVFSHPDAQDPEKRT